MAEEMLDIVNEKDEVIGKASRKEVHEKGLLHRVVHVVIENKKKEILTLTRSLNADTRPGFISNCAEHLKSGETYQEAAERAPQEELGVKVKPDLHGKVIVYDGKHNTIIGCFKAESDGPFKLDLNELQKTEFKSTEKIRKEISNGKKYSPTFIAVFEKLYGGRHNG